MALPLKPGLTPSEVAFLCEMELVNVIPRQRLEGLELLGGPTQPLNPPFPTPLPLWLALLLKRQRRANIVPPPWLSVDALSSILETEIEHAGEAFSPPPSLPPASTTSPLNPSAADYLSSDNVEFSPPYVSNTTGAAAAEDALPYHWLELSHLLLTSCADDMPQASTLTRLLRDIREVRQSKLRKGITVLDSGAGVQMNGVGAMEVAESRGFVTGVVDGLRRIGASREQTRRETEAEERDRGGGGRGGDGEDDDEDMLQ